MSYIVAEGLDYAGKSHLVRQLASTYKCRVVHEPFGESLASADIREKIRSASLEHMYETQLLIAGRIELFEKLNIFARRNSPTYLLSDRNFLTNMVYQSKTDEDMLRILRLNIDALKAYGHDIMPNVIIYVEVPYEVALARFEERGAQNNLDKKIMVKNVYEKMQEKYKTALEMISSESDKVCVIKATHLTPFEEIVSLLDEHMKTVDPIPVRKY